MEMAGLPSTSRLQAGWVPRAQERKPNCPPGLENLIPLDFFWVQQESEALETTYAVETENRYYVKNHSGLNLFYAMEKSTYCARNCVCCCCCGCRPFEMRISDYAGGEVIHLSRPCICCFDEIHVSSPPGVSIGTVEQQCGFCRPSFCVRDADRHKTLNIRGPSCIRGCCCFGSCCGRNIDFKLVDMKGNSVGKISKQWAGYNTVSDADTFGVSFPVDLEPHMKAVVLGACILIDMIYFEEDPKKKKAVNQAMPH